ncbi:MAG TPA: alkaline phosphatase D family protein [Candidatus Paceibacterota bacterium]|nr:alkaline phosphatase D family protein [Candidatus Paceibacterota bacterium]
MKSLLRLLFLLSFMAFLPRFAVAATLTHGAALGAPDDTSIKVWARAGSSAVFKVEYVLSGNPYPGTITSGVTLLSGADYTGVVSISGLTPDTAYDYRILLDDVVQVGTGASGTFTTQKTEGTACSFRVGLAGDFDASYLGGNFSLLASLKSKSPDFALFSGDQIYGLTAGDEDYWNTFYKDNWDETNFLSFLKDIPTVMMWDDHELPVGNWDSGKLGTGYPAAREAFENYENSKNFSPRIPGEIFFDYKICDTAIFMADQRSYRSPDDALDSANNDMLGTAQMAHLKDWLLNTDSTFKIISVGGNTTKNYSTHTTGDSYSSFQNERTELMNFITKNNIENVVFLTGDQHAVTLYQTSISPTQNYYDFNATPTGASNQSAASTFPTTPSTRVCYNSVQSRHYGYIDIDTTVSPATINFRAFDSSENSICNTTISENDLSLGKPTMSSASNQSFNVSGSTTPISTITIADNSTAKITAANDIRIRIPDSVSMTWDSTDTTAVIGGGASAKVSTTVSYEDSNKTLVLNVTSNFANSDSITVSGLSFTSFTSSVAKTNLGMDINNDDGAEILDSATIEIIPSSGPAIYSYKNQVFEQGQSNQVPQQITILDGTTPSITSGNDIRIKIPSSFNMTWDSTDTTAVIGGGASAKVSTTVSYEDSNKTLVIDVTSNFVAGDYITVSGLSFTSFSGVNTSSNITIDINNNGSGDATDTKSIRIVTPTTKVWTGLANSSVWSDPENWSGQTVPASGDDVVFDSTSVVDVVADYIADNLNSITLETGYTGTVTITPYAQENNFEVLNVNTITVNQGTLVFEGDSHQDSDLSTVENDGTGFTINADSVSVGASGIISANGEGFEQCLGPGSAVGNSSGGTGGSYGGVGGRNLTFAVNAAATYGSATEPLSLGSGGCYGGGSPDLDGSGGSGGGALKFNITTSIDIDGTLSANGDNARIGTTNARYGAGSGGSIWINGGTLTGSGTISAKGGDANVTGSTGGGGGGGRISLADTTDSFSGTIDVSGGSPDTAGGHTTTGGRGYAGTVIFSDTKMDNFVLSNTLYLGNDVDYSFGTLNIQNGGTLYLDSNYLDETGATLTVDNLDIDVGGTLSALGLGYEAGDTNADGIPTAGTSADRSGGGGHGGRGGNSSVSYGSTGGATYGSATAPVTLGSGPYRKNGGAGGGAIKLNIGDTAIIDGTVTVDGKSASPSTNERGAGAGGSIWINGGTLTGSGTISAKGGDGKRSGGGGGGGRISVVDVDTYDFDGSLRVDGGSYDTSSTTTAHDGYAGTIAFPTGFDLVVSNTMSLGNAIDYTFQSVTIENGGTLILDIDPAGDSSNGTGTTINAANFTINSGGTLSADRRGHNDVTGPSGGRGAAGTGGRYGGGAHGGNGGVGSAANGSPAGGTSYDTSTAPTMPGAGHLGGNSLTQGPGVTITTKEGDRGGGAIKLNVTNNLVVNGEITSDGYHGSAGGSIWIVAKNYSGTSGLITANGGACAYGSTTGSGGGGRVRIEYVNKTYSGTAPTASFGTCSTVANRGADGTVSEASSADSTAPSFSSVSVSSVTHNSATITWFSNEESSTQVEYGTTVSYGTTTTETDTSPRVLSHSVSLTGLSSSTTYHFRVLGTDDGTNSGVGTDQTFTTDAPPDLTAPSISNINVVEGVNSATITWDTDETASTQVEYGTTVSYGTTTTETDTSPRVLSHSVEITGLVESTTYHFRVVSKDASTNTATSSDQTFTTASSDSTAPILSNITASSGTNTISIMWTTDESSSSIVEYGTTSSYGNITAETDTSPRVTSHLVTISNLINCTSYNFRVKSNDALSNLATSSNAVIKTLGCPKYGSVAVNPSVIYFTSINNSNNQSTNNSEFKFLVDLKEGMTHPDIKKLQEFLNSKNIFVAISGVGSVGKETNFFGPATKNAVINFQKKNNILPSLGFVGPKTREFINGLLGGGTQTPIVVIPEKNTPSEFVFSINMKVGTVNEEVRNLQKFLNQNGFIVATSGPGSVGNETNVFGSKTLDAVKKFQQANALTPVDGLVGPKTREILNKK